MEPLALTPARRRVGGGAAGRRRGRKAYRPADARAGAGQPGTAADGRTVLLDWTYPGEGPACHELGWYLAPNRSRSPLGHTKESTIEAFRAALERHGVATGPWWEQQLGLALLGTPAQFGWE